MARAKTGMGFTKDIKLDIPDAGSAARDAVEQAAIETRAKWDAITRAGKRAGRETPRMFIDIRSRKGAAVARLTVAAFRLYTLRELETRPSLEKDTTGAQREPIFYKRKDAMRAFSWVEVPDAFVWNDLIMQRKDGGGVKEARADFGPRDELSWYRDDLTSDLEERVSTLLKAAL